MQRSIFHVFNVVHSLLQAFYQCVSICFLTAERNNRQLAYTLGQAEKRME